jgi:type I restriction enzyme, S subunit
MSEWKEVKVGDVVDSISLTHDLKDKNIVLINTSDVLNGKVLNHKYVKNENIKGQFKKTFKEGDILYSEIRPKNKRFAFVDFDASDYVASTKLMVLRRKSEEINNSFLFKALSSDRIVNYLQSLAETRSGTFPQITFSELSMLKLTLPSIPEQKAIAKVLSDLDEKIDINNKINKTLEEMAQAIFKQWFMDFNFPNEDGKPYKDSGGEMVESELGLIPKGWQVGCLREMCEISSSKRIFSKEYVENGVPFYRSKEVIERSKGNDISTELFISHDRYEEIKSKFGAPIKGDILLTSVGTLGVSYMIQDEEFYFKDGNLTWFKNYKKIEYRNYIFLLINSGIGKEEFSKISIGSTQKALTITSLNRIKIVIPDIVSLKEFMVISESVLRNIESYRKQTKQLKKLRDTLLPKLMSGEVSVKYEEEE